MSTRSRLFPVIHFLAQRGTTQTACGRESRSVSLRTSIIEQVTCRRCLDALTAEARRQETDTND